MKKPNYKATGEITSTEAKQARKKAFDYLEKAKKIEADQMQSGKKYVRIDKRTLKLR